MLGCSHLGHTRLCRCWPLRIDFALHANPDRRLRCYLGRVDCMNCLSATLQTHTHTHAHAYTTADLDTPLHFGARSFASAVPSPVLLTASLLFLFGTVRPKHRGACFLPCHRGKHGSKERPTVDCVECRGSGFIICRVCGGSGKSTPILRQFERQSSTASSFLRCTVCNENRLERCPKC